METWMKEYSKQFLKMVTLYPADYGADTFHGGVPVFLKDRVPAVIAAMRSAFQRRTYNKEGRAIKATCKAFGIPHTYKAINHFLDNHA